MAAKTFLILTASIGSGHIKAAEAIRDELKRLHKGTDIYVVDFMERHVSGLNWLLKKLYLKMLAFVPNLYDFLYNFSRGGQGGLTAQKLMARAMLPAVRNLVAEYRPQAIICTHPFPAGAASLLRQKGEGAFRLAVVLTDYSLHQIWLHPHVDMYFTATGEMRRRLINCGFPAKTVFSFGIPVAGSLTKLPRREEILAAHSLSPGKPIILLMGGGLGLGSLGKTLGELESVPIELQIIVIAGRNETLRQKASRYAILSRHSIQVKGYYDKVPQLMRVADLLVSKPGALTISEAFVLGLPMLLAEPIPGPETENAAFATKHGAAVWLHHGESLAKAVEALLNRPAELLAMRRQALGCSRPKAAQDIAKRVSQLLNDSV